MSRLFGALVLFALSCQPLSLQAQAWPACPVRLVVPYPPGGATDFLARIVSQKLAELIALGKSSPARLTYASGGNGTGGHLGLESLKVAAGVDFTHVPYKGTAPAVTDLLGGQMTMMLTPVALVRGHVQSGGLRALATASGARSPAIPDTPTVSEAGVPGFNATAWFGIVVPADTPAPVVSRLNAEFRQVMSLPGVREALTRPGLEPHTTSREEFGRWILDEMQKWEKVVKMSGARVD